MTGSRSKSGYYWVGNWNQNAVAEIENRMIFVMIRQYIKSIESDPIDFPIPPACMQVLVSLAVFRKIAPN
jgi:hypothetical protein